MRALGVVTDDICLNMKINCKHSLPGAPNDNTGARQAHHGICFLPWDEWLCYFCLPFALTHFALCFLLLARLLRALSSRPLHGCELLAFTMILFQMHSLRLACAARVDIRYIISFKKQERRLEQKKEWLDDHQRGARCMASWWASCPPGCLAASWLFVLF